MFLVKKKKVKGQRAQSHFLSISILSIFHRYETAKIS